MTTRDEQSEPRLAGMIGRQGVEDPPALATQAGYGAVRAVVRRPDDRPLLVLSLEDTLERVYRSGLPGEKDNR